MTVIPVGSLPLGFRFHPTDEELINHYLKRKINGRIRGEIEVIPEVDVCKYEPWDLPAKSVIQSEDPEWFFFSARDRKYPNGHRANRATEAGYWKATGKDRTIKSRSALVGMKKTLVFHRGRAPRGLRTCWIMHEYRTTEPEFDSGEQGSFVLCRLFKKSEESSHISNVDEMEKSGLSPSPTKSSPSETQHVASPVDECMTPLNAEFLQSNLQQDQCHLPNTAVEQPAGIKSWLADNADCPATYPVKYERTHYNSVVGSSVSDHKSEVRHQHAEVDPLLNDFSESNGHRYEQIDSDAFPCIDSPGLPYTTDHFFDVTDQVSLGALFQDDNFEQTELLDAMLSIQDGCFSMEHVVHNHSTDDKTTCNLTASDGFPWDLASGKDNATSRDLDTVVGLGQGASSVETAGWLCGQSFKSRNSLQSVPHSRYEGVPSHFNNSYVNFSLPQDGMPPDSSSVDSAADSLHDLFTCFRETTQNDLVNCNIENLVDTGINIRTRQPPHPINENELLASQGTAKRRVLLQTAIQDGSFPSVDSEYSSNKYGNEVDVLQCGSSINNVHNEVNFIDIESSSNNGDNMASIEAGEKLDHISEESEILSLSCLHKLESFSCRDEITSPKIMPLLSSQYLEPVLRLRSKGIDDTGSSLAGPPMCLKIFARLPLVSGYKLSGYVTRLVQSMILLVLCIGIWRCASMWIV